MLKLDRITKVVSRRRRPSARLSLTGSPATGDAAAAADRGPARVGRGGSPRRPPLALTPQVANPPPASGLAADHRERRGALRGEDVPDQERQRGRQTPLPREHLIRSTCTEL